MARKFKRRAGSSKAQPSRKSNGSGGIALSDRYLSPVAYEARKAAKMARSVSLAWDENEALGLPPDQRRNGTGGTMSEIERKETLLNAYMNIPWISSTVDVTALRLISGGYAIEPVGDNPSEANRAILEEFILRTDEDWDFLQFVEAIAKDIQTFGEAYAEIVWANGKPWALHKIDCITMNYRLARNGQVLGYTQKLTSSTEEVQFEPNEIIRWWKPSLRASMQAMSDVEKLKNSVYSEMHMVDWSHRFFRQGAKPPYWVETPADEDEARRLNEFHRENYTGAKNAHIPPVMYGGAQLHEFSKGAVDVDFTAGRKMNREEILAVRGVPPAMVNIIDSGNIGGGTGESQHKSFQYNACDPLRRIIMEKLNYRIVKMGFGITDWKMTTKYADYRDDTQVADVQDKRIRNGSSTINEERATMGRKAYKKGGDTAIVVAGKDILPVERLDEIADEQREQAELAANPPPPPPPPVPAPGAKTPEDDAAAAQPGDKNAKLVSKREAPPRPTKPPKQGEESEESARPAVLEQHTGVMVAFLLPRDIARRIALPDGEAIEDLHVTLAFLGDKTEMSPADIESLKQCVRAFADNAPPLHGKISGLGRFTSVPDGAPTPVYASVDIPYLPAWRERLVQALNREDFVVNQEHGYTPHITLAYIDADAPMPIERVPDFPLYFNRVTLAIGDERFDFPTDITQERWYQLALALKEDTSLDEAVPADDEPELIYDPINDVWQPADLDAQLTKYREQGVTHLLWETGPDACDKCVLNHGQIVEVGQPFKNGNILPQCHRYCQCEVKPAPAPKEPK